MFHVFQILGDFVSESREAWNEVELFIAEKFLHDKADTLKSLSASGFVTLAGNYESVEVRNEDEIR